MAKNIYIDVILSEERAAENREETREWQEFLTRSKSALLLGQSNSDRQGRKIDKKLLLCLLTPSYRKKTKQVKRKQLKKIAIEERRSTPDKFSRKKTTNVNHLIYLNKYIQFYLENYLL